MSYLACSRKKRSFPPINDTPEGGKHYSELGRGCRAVSSRQTRVKKRGPWLMGTQGGAFSKEHPGLIHGSPPRRFIPKYRAVAAPSGLGWLPQCAWPGPATLDFASSVDSLERLATVKSVT